MLFVNIFMKCDFEGWKKFSFWYVNFNFVLRKTVPQMIKVQKGVVEIQTLGLVGHVPIVGCSRITISQNDVVQEVRYDARGIHQIANGFKYGFEVVFLRFSSH